MQGDILAGRYLLAETLGVGGMGTVYRATDLRTGGPVAVKRLHPFLAQDRQYIARLRREAQIAAVLTSPRVVRVIDIDEADGAPFLVMEYVAGETLAEVLARRGALLPAEAVSVCLEVARAMQAAHAAGIVHRDLKPDNIKLVEGQVKVLDFGIARHAGAQSVTTSGTYLGTPSYSAPERVLGQSDVRADIYALGVILFELLEARLPFEGPTPLAVLRAHESTPPPPLSAGVPGQVAAIVARCLEKRPEDRYQTPADLIVALEDAHAALARAAWPPATLTMPDTGHVQETHATPTRAREAPTAPATASAVAGRSRLWWYAGTAGALIIGVIIVVVMVVPGRGGDGATGEVAGPSAQASSPTEPAAGATGGGTNPAPSPVSPAVSPAGTRAPTAPAATGGQARLAVTVHAGSTAPGFADGIAKQAKFDAPHGLALDAAGNLYVADKYNHRIRKIAPGGVVTTLAGSGVQGYRDGVAADAQFAEPAGVAVAADGAIYVADGGNDRIRRISAAGMVTTVAGTGTRGRDDGPAAAATFSYPAALAFDAMGNLYIVDYGGDAIRVLTPDGTVRTLAGGKVSGFAEGKGEEARFDSPLGVAVGPDGTVYVADQANHRIRRIAADGTVGTFAGVGIAGYADGGPREAKFNQPSGVAADRAGNIYVAESEGARIRKVAPDGMVTTVAGSGQRGLVDGAPETAAFHSPTAVAVGADGVIYVAEWGNHDIRWIGVAGTR